MYHGGVDPCGEAGVVVVTVGCPEIDRNDPVQKAIIQLFCDIVGTQGVGDDNAEFVHDQ